MRFEISEFVSYAEVHGELIVANIETGKYFSIGGIGKQIWELLVKGEDEENIIDTLVQKLHADKHAVSKDVHKFLINLEALKFISTKQMDV